MSITAALIFIAVAYIWGRADGFTKGKKSAPQYTIDIKKKDK